MRRTFTIILLLTCVSLFAQKKEGTKADYPVIPRQVDAFNELKNTADGANWTISDLNELRSRSTFPMIKDGGAVSYNSAGHIPLEIWDLTNNNLSGVISDDFGWQADDPGRWYHPISSQGTFKFSHNQITSVTKFLGFAYYNNYVSELWLDNNNLTSIDIMNPKDAPMNNTSFYLYSSSKKFCIHQNELTTLRMDNLGNIPRYSSALIGYNSELIRIDNNRLNFEDIIHLTSTIATWKAYIPTGGTSAGCDYEFIYAPQKSIGGSHTEVSLDEGASQTLNFELSHSDNVYTWLLNGKPVGSTGTSYTINYMDAKQAGVYTCKVTNPNLTDLELYSFDMAVWMNKNENQDPTNITLSGNTANNKMPRFTNVGRFSGTDPDNDQLYFRMDDKKANNSSFRIINGNTLVVADDLFAYDFITEYTIVVEAYDCYGGKFEKQFTIEKGEPSGTVEYPTAIKLSGSDVDENTIAKVGDFLLEGVNDGDYSLSLPDNQADNGMFELKNTKELHVRSELNFEDKAIYNILLKLISSDNTITLEKDFTINVNNVNDAPNDLALFGKDLIIGAPLNSLVGVFSAKDEDTEDNVFVYEFDNSQESDNNQFRITNNLLLTGKNFDERDVGSKTIRVKAKDADEETIVKAFSVAVKSVATENDPPRGFGLTNTVIADEMQVGDIIGEFYMSDPEGELGTFSCSNDYVKVDGLTLKLKAIPAAGTEINVEFTCSDGENEITQTIAITNNVALAENPRGAGLTNNVITTAMSVGDVVAQIYMSDSDGSVGEFTCTNDYLEIDGSEIKLKSKPAEGLSFTLSLSMSDGALETTQDFTIYVAKDCNGTDVVDVIDAEISIYPNPANSKLNITGIKSGLYSVRNMNGVELIHTNENEINISELSSGIYILQIMFEGRIVNKTFIKQ